MISYYDLLGLMKENKHPKEVYLHIAKKVAKYVYDEEDGYILATNEDNLNILEVVKMIISAFKKLNPKSRGKLLNKQKQKYTRPMLCWNENIFDLYLSDAILDNERFDKIIDY